MQHIVHAFTFSYKCSHSPTRGYSPFVKQLSILLDNTSPCYLPLHSVSLQSSSFPPSLILLLRFFVSFFDNLRLILVGIP